jgi:PIN domain nuclease of toxin-antitoxin system
MILDTHAWLRYLGAGLSKVSVRRIDRARRAGQLRVAAVTLWEIALLVHTRRLRVDGLRPRFLPERSAPKPFAFGAPTRAALLSAIPLHHLPAKDERFATLLRSSNGGFDWEAVPVPPPPFVNSGGAGNSHNAIAVSPTNTNMVVVGWVNNPMLSHDAGNSWEEMTNADAHVHGDKHGMYFRPADPTTPNAAEEFYVATDGGIAMTRSLGDPWTTTFNRALLNLQMDSMVFSESRGNLSVAADTAGAVATGTQDNGVITCNLRDGVWRRRQIGDGFLTAIVTREFGGLPGSELIWTTSMDSFPDSSGFRTTAWDGAHFELDLPELVDPSFGQHVHVVANVIERVENPVIRTSGGGRMLAVGAGGLWSDETNSQGEPLFKKLMFDPIFVWGIFETAATPANPSGLYWENLGAIPVGYGNIIAVAAMAGGKRIVIGTSSGSLFELDYGGAFLAAVMRHDILDGAPLSIDRIVVSATDRAYALCRAS